eukprot:7359760-Alexandrium_andersonii.AAC.1
MDAAHVADSGVSRPFDVDATQEGRVGGGKLSPGGGQARPEALDGGNETNRRPADRRVNGAEELTP